MKTSLSPLNNSETKTSKAYVIFLKQNPRLSESKLLTPDRHTLWPQHSPFLSFCCFIRAVERNSTWVMSAQPLGTVSVSGSW